MKLKFKIQPFQTSAVESVVDCFASQVNTSGIPFTKDGALFLKLARLSKA